MRIGVLTGGGDCPGLNAVIRGVLLPASMKLLGDWNWYLPRRLRRLPALAVEPSR